MIVVTDHVADTNISPATNHRGIYQCNLELMHEQQAANQVLGSYSAFITAQLWHHTPHHGRNSEGIVKLFGFI